MVSVSLRTLILCLLLVMLTAVPTAADILNPTVTRVYFEKDGAPYNHSVSFSVNCTGCYWDMKEWKVPENCRQEQVFSYSATCPTYGCVIYETFYLNYKEISQCDLTGETKGTKFSIPNFSTTPLPPKCTDVQDTASDSSDTSTGKTTMEYESCMERNNIKDCNKFLLECKQTSPAENDGNCGWYRSETNRTLRTTPAFGTCLNNTREKQKTCNAYLEPATRKSPAAVSPMELWKSGDNEMPARRICEIRFTIPSEAPVVHATPVTTPAATSLSGKDPLKAIYCRLPSFAGKRC